MFRTEPALPYRSCGAVLGYRPARITLGIAAYCLGVLFTLSPVSGASHSPKQYPVPDIPLTRDLVSLSIDQVVEKKLDTGVYAGSEKVRANREEYERDFYGTLASRKHYLDEKHTRWEIIPIPQEPPPACDQPQPTKYDADSCRYIKNLFTELDTQDPERARRYREQVRRGRDVWFEGTFGNQDLYNVYLSKLLGSVPDYSSWLDTRNRDQRFKRYGLINDPDCRPGNEQTYWLDDCTDAHASGVLGVRKYYAAPSKDFDPHTSPYTEGELAQQKRFVFGFSCAHCHVTFDPTNPPKDPAHPEWENLMGGIGNQYLTQTALYTLGLPEDHFLRVLSEAQRPGTSDTSLVANDFIHNPGTMNAIMNTHNRRVFKARMKDPLTGQISTARTRHVLKGGEDSIGEHLALLRVYVNIGLCAMECWTPNFPEIGAVLFDTEQKPFRIKACSEQCEAWNHADAKIEDLLAYLISIGPTYLDKALDVDGTPGSSYIDHSMVPKGREVYITHCARCHSSKELPEFIDREDKTTMAEYFKGHVFGGFHNWRREFQPSFLASTDFADYLDEPTGLPRQQLAMQQDWLGNDELVPYHEIGVNRCRSIQTNHLEGHIWEEFSSETYKERPSPGAAPKTINPLVPLAGGSNPFDMEQKYEGGRGYMRNISLLSVWSSAPLLHNNALGPYPRLTDGTPDYTVKGRVKAFESAMQELLTSDKQEDSPHREPVIWKVKTDVEVPTREDGKSLIKLTLPAGEPIGWMGSVDPHHPIFSNCDEYVENQGHQFGIDLSKEEKTALIEFMKTL